MYKLGKYACNGSDIVVKYDFSMNTHSVYFGLKDNVRRVIFPTKDEAIRLVDALLCYEKINVK